MQHPDEGIIHAWLDGALDPVESARLEQHVATCGECAALAAEARGMIAGASRITSMLDVVPGGVIPMMPAQPVRKTSSVWTLLRVTPARAALAASLLIAASGVLAVRHDTATKMVPRAIVVQGDSANGATRRGPWVDAPVVAPAAAATTAPTAAMPASPPTTPAAKMQPVRGATAEKTAAAVVGGPPSLRLSNQVVSSNEPAAMNAARADADSGLRARASGAAAPSAADAQPAGRAAMQASAQATGRTEPGGDARADARSEKSNSSTLDSTARAALARRAELRGRAAFATESRSVVSLEEVVKTTVSNASAFAGCYRITTDSMVWSRSLPRAFSLTTTSEQNGGAHNIVRVVGSDGRVDSVVSGSTWRQTAPNIASVTFANADVRSSLTLQFVGNTQVRADASVEARKVAVPIAKVECRP